MSRKCNKGKQLDLIAASDNWSASKYQSGNENHGAQRFQSVLSTSVVAQRCSDRSLEHRVDSAGLEKFIGN